MKLLYIYPLFFIQLKKTFESSKFFGYFAIKVILRILNCGFNVFYNSFMLCLHNARKLHSKDLNAN